MSITAKEGMIPEVRTHRPNYALILFGVLALVFAPTMAVVLLNLLGGH